MAGVTLDSFTKFLGDEAAAADSKVSFVEDKSVDLELVQGFLDVSKKKNHWSNFGPVSLYLENVIEELLGLSSSRKVIMCSSGTSALQALIGLEDIKAGRRLKWVVSAYGFIASHIGPLADAVVLDCDEKGILSLEALKNLDENWDGVLLTNPFALCPSFKETQDFCEAEGKACLVDNAGAFINEARGAGPDSNELISFHHTKPWGFGEGGCAIVDKGDEADFRSLLNFGNPKQKTQRAHVSNWKLSDVSSAYILQRLAHLGEWSERYKRQSKRVQTIGAEYGFRPLCPVPPEAVLGNVPLLSPVKVDWKGLDNPYVTLNKYYIPLAGKHENARSIFSRVINFPCHSGVEDLKDAELSQVFETLLDANKG